MLEAAANAQQEPHIPWEWIMCWRARQRYITGSQKTPPGPWQRWSPPCPSSQPTLAGRPIAHLLVVQPATKEDWVVIQTLCLFWLQDRLHEKLLTAGSEFCRTFLPTCPLKVVQVGRDFVPHRRSRGSWQPPAGVLGDELFPMEGVNHFFADSNNGKVWTWSSQQTWSPPWSRCDPQSCAWRSSSGFPGTPRTGALLHQCWHNSCSSALWTFQTGLEDWLWWRLRSQEKGGLAASLDVTMLPGSTFEINWIHMIVHALVVPWTISDILWNRLER